MNKKIYIYLGIFILVIGLLMYLDYTKPKPIDWAPTYSTKDKIPYGTYVLYKEVSKLFSKEKIKLVEETPATFLRNNQLRHSAYVLINTGHKPSYSISDADAENLLKYVKEGNDVFISSNRIPKSILDSLNLKTADSYYIANVNTDKVSVYLVNQVFSKYNYQFKNINTFEYFSQLDSVKTVVLGEYKAKEEKNANFIKQKYGKGYFFLHLFPQAYSNYYMLNDSTYTYAVNSLNYIDKKNIYWDETRKDLGFGEDPNQGLLYFVFKYPPLLWAWRIIIFGTLVYFIFFGKRLQRIIPIINPLQNTTVEFTKTIGNLYYNSHNHQDVINKKILYFLYFIKDKYFMNLEKIDSNFSEKLHLKSGVSKEVTDKIVLLIQKNKRKQNSSEEDLKDINRIIDLFYKKIK